MRMPGGGRLLPGCGASGVGRSPSPDHSSFRACGRGPLPTGCGCGGPGRGEPSRTPQRANASSLCALWGRHEGARGGRLLPGCGASGVGRSPTPDHSSLRACGRGPLPTGCGCGGVGAWGPVTNPTARALASSLCALWGRHEGAPGGLLLPGCGASGVGRSPTPDHSSFWACDRGPLPTGCGCGGCGHGDPSPTPQRALLRAGFARCGGGMRMPGGGRLLPGCGASGVGRSPTPDHSSLWACGRGPLHTGCGCGGCERWDQSLTPQCALLRAGCARCGGGMRVPGGGASCLGVGRPGSGALPPPTTRPFGRAAGAHYPLAVAAGGWGHGDPSPTPQRALLRAHCARCGGGMRVPRGGSSCLGVGRPGLGALPPPTTRPLGRAAGAHYPLAVGAGRAGVGTRHQPHSAHSCVLALRAVEAA